MKINPAQAIKLFFLAIAASFVFAGKALAAPSLLLDPTSQTAIQNTPFTVTVNINVEAQSAFGADAVIVYTPSDIEVVSVTKGNFFSDFNHANDAANGRLELHGFFSSLYDSKSGAGTLATISWKAKRDTGTGTLAFLCGSSATTQILNTNGQNILSCTGVNQTSLTYSGNGTQPTATVAPTSQQPTTAPTLPPGAPTPTTPIGGGGNTTPTCASLVVSSVVNAPINSDITFTCTGVDPDGFVSAAEFDFGDRTGQVVEKHAGSPGAISTTHKYPYAATWGATCRVRDNNNVFSAIPDNCRKTIKTVVGPTPIPTAKPPINPNPTPVIVNLVAYATPTPAPKADEVPSAPPDETDISKQEGASFPRILLFVILVLAALGILLYFLKGNRRHADMQPPTPTGSGQAGGPPGGSTPPIPPTPTPNP